MDAWIDIALEELGDIYEECSEEDWDGYKAVPLSKEAYLAVKKLLNMISESSFPQPDILPEPDGSIGLLWFRDDNSCFIVSIPGDNIIFYVGRFGGNNTTHGIEYLSNSLPEVITDNLIGLFNIESKEVLSDNEA